jgi:hypothetical protein
MYLLGGYLYSPDNLRAYFSERGVTLREHGIGITANRFLREKYGRDYRVKSCMYNDQQMYMFIAASRLMTPATKGFHFVETAEARQMKSELGLQDAEFVTAIY